jgi:hypothetical protein
MATKIGLSAYRLELKQQRGELWMFARNSATDGYALLNGYLQNRRGRLVRLGTPDADGNYADNRAIMLTRFVHNDQRRLLAGLMLHGEAGRILEIRNFDDPEAEPSYTTGINEGVLSPLYFRIHIDDGRPFAVLIAQTSGIDGMKGYIDVDLRHYCNGDCDPKMTHKLTQLVDISVLERFAAQGQLQDVIAINGGKSQASREAMQNHTVAGQELGEEGDKLALRLHRKGGWPAAALRRILAAIRRGDDPRDLIDTPGITGIDDLQVEISQGGTKQIFSLLNPDDSPIRYDISNNIRRGADGLPTWESVHAAADDVWDSISAII